MWNVRSMDASEGSGRCGRWYKAFSAFQCEFVVASKLGDWRRVPESQRLSVASLSHWTHTRSSSHSQPIIFLSLANLVAPTAKQFDVKAFRDSQKCAESRIFKESP